MSARLNRNSSMPIVKITVGNAQPATYKSKLVLANEKRIDVGSASEVDFSNVTDISTIDDLNKGLYMWDVRVIKATTNSGEVHTVTVSIFQDGNTVFSVTDPTADFGSDNVYTWTDAIDFSVA